MKLIVNDREFTIDADPRDPLLWALRDMMGLTGTKFGCGAAQCGACTVHLDGEAIRSCVTPISDAEGKKLTTIEAATDGTDRVGAAVHAAWVKHDVAQCGYCQSGQIMSASAFLKSLPARQAAHRRRNRRGHGRQHLPLRHLRPHPRCCCRRRPSPRLKEPPCCPISTTANCRVPLQHLLARRHTDKPRPCRAAAS